MQIKFYKGLPLEAKQIRQSVFCDEQGFQNEFDDLDSVVYHMVLFDGEAPIGCARFFQEKDYFVLSAQVQAQGFYEKLGYVASGEPYLDEHCPHIHMEKQG